MNPTEIQEKSIRTNHEKKPNNISSGCHCAHRHRSIKYCALAIIGFVVVEEIFIMLNHGSDDPAGGVFMGILITFGSIVIATAAGMFERILQSAVDIKSENDLTV